MKNKFYKDYLNNINELISLSNNIMFNKLFKDKEVINIDNYISFLKDNLNINHNELLILIDLTIYQNNKVLFSSKDYNHNYEYFNKRFIQMFMYKYNKNIKFLKNYIKIDKLNFNDLVIFLNNKKRVYIFFEDINEYNIHFYLPLIIELIN